ncbi:MAG: enoyl-CoA hydratase/isomerase family protein [Bryobacteraceae bacterium]
MIRIEQDGRLRRITLASPETRNFLDEDGCQRLFDEIRDGIADTNTGAILLEAEGPVFCSGARPAEGCDLFTIGRRMTKPLVISAQGVVISGGVAILANAHVALAAQGTSFGITEMREHRWSVPIYEALAHAIGARRALELGLTGRIFSTPDALTWGLIHQAAPAFELADRASDVAFALSQADANAVRDAFGSR